MNKNKTMADIAFHKSVVFNGRKLSGVQGFNIEYSLENGITIVTLKMAIKRNSFRISEGRGSKQTVSFESIDFKLED